MQRLADDGFLKRRLIIGKSSLARNIAFSSTLFAPSPYLRHTPFSKRFLPLKQLFEKLKDSTVVVLTIVQARTLPMSQKTWECIISAKRTNISRVREKAVVGGVVGGKILTAYKRCKREGGSKEKEGKERGALSRRGRITF